MLVKRIAACTIYLQPFTSHSEILVGNCNFFLPLAFNAPDDLRDFWWESCRMARLQYGAKNIPEKLNSLHRARTSQTTDRRICHAISQT